MPFLDTYSQIDSWWVLQGSNLRPSGYEPDALPSELSTHISTYQVVGRHTLVGFRVSSPLKLPRAMEQLRRIELPLSAWEADVLPLN